MRLIAVALLCLGSTTSLYAYVNEAKEAVGMRRITDANKLVITFEVDREIKTKQELFSSLPRELSSKLDENRLEFLFAKPIPMGRYEAWVQYDLLEGVTSDVEAIEKSGLLMKVHYNHQYKGDPRDLVQVNDPMLSRQTHHALMKSELAWNFSLGSPKVIVGITDDGIDIDHEDLKRNIWKNLKEIPNNSIDDDKNGYIDDVTGWDFIEDDNDPHPAGGDFGGMAEHGTHVAGIVAAEANNGKGVSGIAPRVSLMPLKFYGGGNWTSAIIARSYAYATDNGAKIISTSYNVDGFANDPVYEAALDYAYDKGVLIFNSAGNNNSKDPARDKFDQFLLICSTDTRGNGADVRSSFSNYGVKIDLCAPGGDILSTVPRNAYEEMSGTSMATPAAAGVAALIWSVFPNLTREQVVARMMGTAEPLSAKNPGFDGQLGVGRVHPLRAILDRPRAPRIMAAKTLESEVDQIKGVRELVVSVRGIFEKDSIENISNFVLQKIENETEVPVTLSMPTKYRLGTNEIKLVTSEVLSGGSYRLIVKGSKMKDPFKRQVDGDGDRQPGGDFVFNFEAPAPIDTRPPPPPPTVASPDPTVEEPSILHPTDPSMEPEPDPVGPLMEPVVEPADPKG